MPPPQQRYSAVPNRLLLPWWLLSGQLPQLPRGHSPGLADHLTITTAVIGSAGATGTAATGRSQL